MAECPQGEKMKPTVLQPATKKAIALGSMCALAYLAVYVAKNTLSAASPLIMQAGAFTKEQIGTMSSAYFITYAIGQLINGRIGDKIKGKYMISFGLALAAFGYLVLPQLAGKPMAAVVAYCTSGFSMAMIYGPMTRLVAENTEPDYAPRCAIGYTLSSFLGSPLAGLLAAVLAWQWVLRAPAIFLILMGLVCFVVFTMFERKGIITYSKSRTKEKTIGGWKKLLDRQIIRFTFVSILTGVVRTSVVFWLPTYLSSFLGFSTKKASLIFTVATLLISCSIFAAVAIYEKLNRKMEKGLLLSFGCSAICFLGAYFIRVPWVNVGLMVLGILANNSASSLMWSCYCPSLRDTGMVSTATGFLDFCSYMAASVSSAAFANSVDTVGWGGLILVSFLLMLFGVLVALSWKIKFNSKKETR